MLRAATSDSVALQAHSQAIGDPRNLFRPSALCAFSIYPSSLPLQSVGVGFLAWGEMGWDLARPPRYGRASLFVGWRPRWQCRSARWQFCRRRQWPPAVWAAAVLATLPAARAEPDRLMVGTRETAFPGHQGEGETMAPEAA